MPIFVARQWVRHRTARLNEISGRYSIMRDEFYIPEAYQMRTQSTDNKQARGEERLPDPLVEKMLHEFEQDQRTIYAHYEGMIEDGLARELARTNLPLSLYTEWYWQIDLHNLFHFLRLRMDAHAQYEIRVFAEAMARCAKAVAPLAYEAFEEHVLHGVRLSRQECLALVAIMDGKPNPLEGRSLDIFEKKLEKMRGSREIPEPEEPQVPSPV
jgi:thymidylate synthase (FAD)